MTTRKTSFRESDHPGIVFPGNVLSWKMTIRETTFRETTFREKTIRESNHPGNDRIPTETRQSEDVIKMGVTSVSQRSETDGHL